LTDLAKPLGDRIVHVAADHAGADRQGGGAPQRHVLADLGNGAGDGIGDGVAADLGLFDLLEVGAGGEHDVGNHPDQALKEIVAGDEIGLRINFDDGALGRGQRNPDETFRGNAAGLLGGLGEPLLAQEVDGCLHVPAGLAER